MELMGLLAAGGADVPRAGIVEHELSAQEVEFAVGPPAQVDVRRRRRSPADAGRDGLP